MAVKSVGHALGPVALPSIMSLHIHCVGRSSKNEIGIRAGQRDKSPINMEPTIAKSLTHHRKEKID